MPTANRTTVKTAIDTFVSLLRTNLVASPPTATKPFRSIAIGDSGAVAFARPYLAVQLTHARIAGVMDNDKIIEVGMTLRSFVDAMQADAHAAMLDAIGAVDDYLDSLIDTGLLEGASGFDDRDWHFEYAKTSSGSRVVSVTGKQTFVVTVQRLQNRVPAA